MATETKKKTTTRAAAPRARKTATEKAKVAEAAPEIVMTKDNYVPAVGRRKTAIARVRLVKSGKGMVRVNNKALATYFPTAELQDIVMSPLKTVGMEQTYDVSVVAQGGGVHSQAEAVRLGISRALLKIDAEMRKSLKKLGYLTRDPRAKERKKPGLRRARRSPQWSKR